MALIRKRLRVEMWMYDQVRLVMVMVMEMEMVMEMMMEMVMMMIIKMYEDKWHAS